MTRLLTLLAAAAFLGSGPAAAAGRPRPPRSAIVVGAMAPVPGRGALRHAYRDAETIRDVLVSVGGFEAGEVRVLRDPEPDALLALVSREARALAGLPQGLLFFYYSGHADQRTLYSAGKAVLVEALRAALDRPEVSLRVGVLDACQGGGWTRAKGLVPDEPFEVSLPALLASEGSALIASSSGSESAHESDALAGSFFTHHFAAALRGAADQRQKGEVTLTEAFEYARRQTIRETARLAAEPQHPSFAINLKGRQDVVLAQVATSPSALAVEQAEGPIELIHLASGLRLLELPPGRRAVTLAVPPGSYLVRKVTSEGVLAREVAVPATGSARVREHDLVLVGTEDLLVKGREAPVMRTSWPSAGGGELAAGMQTWRDAELGYVGLGTGDAMGTGAMFRFDGRYGITNRLAWKIGTFALAYRIGEDGGVEVAPFAGLLSWKVPLGGPRDTPEIGGFYRGDGELRFGGGVGARFPFSRGAFVLSLEADRNYIGEVASSRYFGAVGLSLAFGRVVTVHVAMGLERVESDGLVISSAGLTQSYGGNHLSLSLGSVQEFGLESLPLVRVRPWDTWAFDLFAGSAAGRRVCYRLGVSRAL